MVRPKKYKKGETTNPCTFYNHPRFRKTWDMLIELSNKDSDNKDFSNYVSNIEGDRLDKYKKQGNRACYVRWILTKHVMENIRRIKSQQTTKKEDAKREDITTSN